MAFNWKEFGKGARKAATIAGVAVGVTVGLACVAVASVAIVAAASAVSVAAAGAVVATVAGIVGTGAVVAGAGNAIGAADKDDVAWGLGVFSSGAAVAAAGIGAVVAYFSADRLAEQPSSQADSIERGCVIDKASIQEIAAETCYQVTEPDFNTVDLRAAFSRNETAPLEKRVIAYQRSLTVLKAA